MLSGAEPASRNCLYGRPFELNASLHWAQGKRGSLVGAHERGGLIARLAYRDWSLNSGHHSPISIALATS